MYFAATLSASLAFIALCNVPSASAQLSSPTTIAESTTSVTASGLLPDAPERVAPALSLGTSAFAQSNGSTSSVPKPPGRYDIVILPGQTAQRLAAGQKVIYGIRDATSPYSAIGWLLSAGYSVGTNGSPNFGQDGKGFAQNLGAAAARASSETIFGESILAPIFHEDPRYYQQGKGKSFLYRLVYSGTRCLITRTDGGHLTPNLQSLGGNLAGAELTQAYYPPLNRGTTQVLETFGGSVGGSALGNVVSEFLPAFLQTIHLQKRAE